MPRLQLSETALGGVLVVQRQPLGDDRGFLARLFCAQELSVAGWSRPVSQINHTHTARSGTLRGLHFQSAPHEDMKLVTCLRGEVWDVVVDLRPDSATFLRWTACHLTAGNQRALLIPEGCAHGYQSLSDDVELLYCHTAAHEPLADAGLHPLDPQLAIAWPLAVSLLSQRDAALPLLEHWLQEPRT